MTHARGLATVDSLARAQTGSAEASVCAYVTATYALAAPDYSCGTNQYFDGASLTKKG